MKFINLKIENFKCFSSYDWDFSPGLNIVFGPNESGKTSLYQALVLSLFGPHTTREKHFGDLGRDDFTPLGTELSPVLKVTFGLANERVAIIRDFSESKVSISNDIESENLQIFQARNARNFIKDILGGIEEEMFTKYASINHVELARLDAAKYENENKEMGQSLLKIVESRQGANILDVNRKITTRLKTIKKTTKNYESKLDEYHERLVECNDAESKLSEFKKSRNEMSDSIEKKTKRRDELSTVVNAVTSRRDLNKKITSLEELANKSKNECELCQNAINNRKELIDKLEKYPSVIVEGRDEIFKKVMSIQKSKDTLSGKRESVSERYESQKAKLQNEKTQFEDIHGRLIRGVDDIAKFKELDNQKKANDQHIHDIDIQLESLNRQKDDGVKRRTWFNRTGYACLVLGSAFLVFGYFSGLHLLWAILLITVLISLSFSTVFFVLGIKAIDRSVIDDLKSLYDKKESFLKELANLESVMTQLSSKLGLTSRDELDFKYDLYRRDEAILSELGNQVRDLEKESNRTSDEIEIHKTDMAILLEETGYSTLADLRDAINHVSDIQQAIHLLSERIENETIVKRLSEAKSNLTESTILLNDLKTKFDDEYISDPIGEDEYILKENELIGLKTLLPGLELEKTKLDVQINTFEDQSDEGHEIIEERIDRLNDALISLKLENEELEYLKVLISELETTYKSQFLPDLEKRALKLFNAFAETSDKTFNLAKWPSIDITSEELADFDERHLSQGTRDQLYFALRIAWNDILSPSDLKLPLIWDDPFVYWDETRIHGVCTIAKTLVEAGHQLIVFTHREELVNFFKRHFDEFSIKITSLNT